MKFWSILFAFACATAAQANRNFPVEIYVYSCGEASKIFGVDGIKQWESEKTVAPRNPNGAAEAYIKAGRISRVKFSIDENKDIKVSYRWPKKTCRSPNDCETVVTEAETKTDLKTLRSRLESKPNFSGDDFQRYLDKQHTAFDGVNKWITSGMELTSPTLFEEVRPFIPVGQGFYVLHKFSEMTVATRKKRYWKNTLEGILLFADRFLIDSIETEYNFAKNYSYGPDGRAPATFYCLSDVMSYTADPVERTDYEKFFGVDKETKLRKPLYAVEMREFGMRMLEWSKFDDGSYYWPVQVREPEAQEFQ